MKRGCNSPSFNWRWNKAFEFHIYNFYAAFDYSSLHRSIYFWSKDTTLKKCFSTEKFNLTWNKPTDFNKLCLLSPPPQKKKKVKKNFKLNIPLGISPPTGGWNFKGSQGLINLSPCLPGGGFRGNER